MPVFEGLMPNSEDDDHIQMLLYRANEFHTLAKLRQHTDTTLGLLELATETFQHLARDFRDTTCIAHKTLELPREVRARARKQAREAPAQGSGTSTAGESAVVGRREKSLNLNTYKFHSLGDYTPTIRMFGTLDIYSTQKVSWFNLLEVRLLMCDFTFTG
jgi:hypothetical protein